MELGIVRSQGAKTGIVEAIRDGHRRHHVRYRKQVLHVLGVVVTEEAGGVPHGDIAQLRAVDRGGRRRSAGPQRGW
jgi:hypothetical protein